MTAALLGALLLAGAPARAGEAERPCEPARPGERFAVDFADAPLGDVVRLVSCAAGLGVLFAPPGLAGKRITVVAARPVALPDLVALLRAALLEHGLALERRGAYHVVRPADEVRPAPTPARRQVPSNSFSRSGL